MSQAELAARLGDYGITLDATGITRLEKGRRTIRLNEAMALAQILGIEAAGLIELEIPDTAEAIEAETERVGAEVNQLEAEVAQVATQWVQADARRAELVRRLGYLRTRLAVLRAATDDARERTRPAREGGKQ
jgi:transcriptional regulator with XRE-family HTH domain